jgi:hypothetical protein
VRDAGVETPPAATTLGDFTRKVDPYSEMLFSPFCDICLFALLPNILHIHISSLLRIKNSAGSA